MPNVSHYIVALVFLIGGGFLMTDGYPSFSVAFLERAPRATSRLWAEPAPLAGLRAQNDESPAAEASLVRYMVKPLEFGSSGGRRLPETWQELFKYFALPDQILIASMKRHWGKETDNETRVRLNNPKFAPREGQVIEIVVN